MREIRRFLEQAAGVRRPLLGSTTPILACGLLGLLSVGCGAEDKQQSLPLLQVGISCAPMGDGCESAVPPIYEDDETTIYEVKKGIQFPILQPSETDRRPIPEGEPRKIEPYGRRP